MAAVILGMTVALATSGVAYGCQMFTRRDTSGNVERCTTCINMRPPGEIDVRREGPSPPEGLSEAEKRLWQRLVESRRPQWFSGALELLARYCVTISEAERIEAELRNAAPGSDRHSRVARLHRQAVTLAATLATKLRLVPSTRLDKRTPQDGGLPVG